VYWKLHSALPRLAHVHPQRRGISAHTHGRVGLCIVYINIKNIEYGIHTHIYIYRQRRTKWPVILTVAAYRRYTYTHSQPPVVFYRKLQGEPRNHRSPQCTAHCLPEGVLPISQSISHYQFSPSPPLAAPIWPSTLALWALHQRGHVEQPSAA
jgi:hypothetical protein